MEDPMGVLGVRQCPYEANFNVYLTILTKRCGQALYILAWLGVCNVGSVVYIQRRCPFISVHLVLLDRPSSGDIINLAIYNL